MTHDQIAQGADGVVGDVNNDGRQDVLLAYANASPVTLKWRLPGGQAQSREVLVGKGGTLRFDLKWRRGLSDGRMRRRGKVARMGPAIRQADE